MKMKWVYWFLFSPILLFAYLESLLNQPPVKNAFVGIYVFDIEQNQVVFQSMAEKLFVPASLQKILVAMSAFELLGADYRFTTNVLVNGSISQGVVKGDILLQGGGDPLLDNKDLDLLVEEVKKKGIKRIEGSIGYDTQLFSGFLINPTWNISDLGTYNAVEPSALSFQGNSLLITVKDNDGQVGVEIENQFSLKVHNFAKIGAKNTLRISRKPYNNDIIITGELAKGQSIARRITLTNPEYYCALLFKKKLAQAGIQVDHCKLQPARVHSSNQKIATIYSKPMLQQIKMMMKKSDNLIPEQLIRILAKQSTGVGHAEQGLNLLTKQLQKKGIKNEYYILFDGSGLSRKNLISPYAVVQLLLQFQHCPYKRDFFVCLPVSGVDGTLKDYCKQELTQRVFAKTGSMQGIRNLAGFLLTKKGNMLAFCIMINHFLQPNSQVEDWINCVLLDLYINQ